MRNQGLFPKPIPPVAHHDWCLEEVNPDPGIVDHYSREWVGRAPLDVDSDAHWKVQVTRRTINGAPDLAVIDVEVSGTYPTTAPIMAALREAQALVHRLNIGVRVRREVTR